MHLSAEDSGGDGEPVEEVQPVHSGETESVTIPTVVTTGGTTSTATTTTPTASTSTATSASAFLPKKPRSSSLISEEDAEKMIEWLQENRFIYDMKSGSGSGSGKPMVLFCRTSFSSHWLYVCASEAVPSSPTSSQINL